MERSRLDKWLWHARFYRTRPLAQRACEAGILRLNGQRIDRSSATLKCGDILTLPVARQVVAVKVLAFAIRRGPAPEARRLYAVLDETVLDPGAPAP